MTKARLIYVVVIACLMAYYLTAALSVLQPLGMSDGDPGS